MSEYRVQIEYRELGDNEEVIQTYWIPEEELKVVIRHLEAVKMDNPALRPPTDTLGF
jgi:hypothetical protein